jgi:hypothetical protein
MPPCRHRGTAGWWQSWSRSSLCLCHGTGRLRRGKCVRDGKIDGKFRERRWSGHRLLNLIFARAGPPEPLNS